MCWLFVFFFFFFAFAAADQEPKEWNCEEGPGAELRGNLLRRDGLAAAARRRRRHAVRRAAETLSGHGEDRQGEVRGVERRHQPRGSAGQARWVDEGIVCVKMLHSENNF